MKLNNQNIIFEVSDTKALFAMFDLYQKEVDNCLEAKLVLPAL